MLARYPHQLIDLKDPAESYSAGEFVEDARGLRRRCAEGRRLPLLVGGTMLYFKAFKEGIADLPPRPRACATRTCAASRPSHGFGRIARRTAAVDPVAAAGIHPNNPQRLLRALEVYATSGRPISDFWARQQRRRRRARVGLSPASSLQSSRRAKRSTRVSNVGSSEMLHAGLLDEVRG